MNNPGQALLYILLLVISLATGYWFYNNFAWVNEKKEIGFQGIAKTNKLLASEFFLRKMGVRVQQVNGLVGLRELPSSKHTILIATQRETLNKELSQKLLAWVRSGGHLIVEARYRVAESIERDRPNALSEKTNKQVIDDYLLEDLMIFSQRVYGDDDKTDENTGNENPVKDSSDDIENAAEKNSYGCKTGEDKEDIPIIVSLATDSNQDGGNTEIEVNFPYYTTLQANHPDVQASWLVKDNIAQYLMQFPLEQGLLTVLTSTSMFNNEQIGQYNHARFLHYLIQQPDHDVGVWLIRVDDMPPLWQWLWQNAWPVMFSLSILFLFWLWRAPMRFGPLLNDEQMERRSLLEHIQASGYYRWHNNQSGYLLSKVQDILWGKIQMTHPDIHRDNPAQAYIKLEEITGIKESLIKQSLVTVDKINEQEFVNRIRVLEMIRRHI